MVNSTRVEVNLLRSTFSDSTLQKLNKVFDQVKSLMEDFEIIKMTTENTVVRSEFHQLQDKIDNMVPLKTFEIYV